MAHRSSAHSRGPRTVKRRGRPLPPAPHGGPAGAEFRERRRSEEALHAGEAMLYAALDSMSDAVFITDTNGRIVEANPAVVSFHRFASRAECPATLAEWHAALELRDADGNLVAPAEWPLPRALRGERGVAVRYRLCRSGTAQAWDGSFSFGPVVGTGGALLGAVVVARDVSAWTGLQRELEASRADVRHLLAQQHRVQEAERMRIARDLHDDLQQALAAVAIELASARARLAAGRHDALPLLDSASDLLKEGVQSMRRVVDDLRPPMLDQLGLVPALHHLLGHVARHAGFACRVIDGGLADASAGCDPEAARTLYRVAQEALNNVAKHAGARQVVLEIAAAGDAGVTLTVRDDGVGFRVAAQRKPDSFGLLGMQERVRAAGGELDIQSGPSGTTVTVRIPTKTPQERHSMLDDRSPAQEQCGGACTA